MKVTKCCSPLTQILWLRWTLLASVDGRWVDLWLSGTCLDHKDIDLFVNSTCLLFQFVLINMLVLQALTLHLEEAQEPRRKKVVAAPKPTQQAVQTHEGFSSLHTAIIAGSVAVVAVSIVLLFRRSNSWSHSYQTHLIKVGVCRISYQHYLDVLASRIFGGHCQHGILTSCKYGLVCFRVKNRWWGLAAIRRLDMRRCWFDSHRLLGSVESVGIKERTEEKGIECMTMYVCSYDGRVRA